MPALRRMKNNRNANQRLIQMMERSDDITGASLTTTELYGGTTAPLFSVFHERPLMSMSMIGRYHPVMDWIGWTPTLNNLVRKGFLTYVAADGAAASTPTGGAVSDPCAPANTIEFGLCDYELSGFGRIRRETPPRSDDNDGLVYHELVTAHRVNGQVIRDEKEMDMLLCTSVLIQDLHRYLIIGNKSNAGEFDGLQQLVTFGYLDTDGNSCSAMDSYVIDWGGLDMGAAISDSLGTQITLNGSPVPDGTYNLYGMMEWVLRNIRIRLAFAPLLRNNITQGEAILMMPTSWIKPFLNVVTCYVKCGGDYAKMTTDAALAFYNSLWVENPNGENLAHARFICEGVVIDITGYDYELDNGDGTADMYLLIKGNSGMDFIYGEYKNNAPTVQNRPDKYGTTDSNMLLTWNRDDETCSVRIVQMQPRLHVPAPWAMVRFQNVPYEGVLSAISSDPLNANYLGNLLKAGYN